MWNKRSAKPKLEIVFTREIRERAYYVDGKILPLDDDHKWYELATLESRIGDETLQHWNAIFPFKYVLAFDHKEKKIVLNDEWEWGGTSAPAFSDKWGIGFELKEGCSQALLPELVESVKDLETGEMLFELKKWKAPKKGPRQMLADDLKRKAKALA